MDCAPYVDENNRTMVPVRFVGQALGATVNWNPSAKTVLVADEENTVVFAVGSDEMTVNGRTTPIDTAAVIQDNRTMLPLRAVAESIGATELMQTAQSPFPEKPHRKLLPLSITKN